MALTNLWQLKKRPTGIPQAEDFELVDFDEPKIRDGEVLVRNRYLSVDPYMRHQMAGTSTYVPPAGVGVPLTGGAVGFVEVSEDPAYTVGDAVFSYLGWRESYVVKTTLPIGLRKIDDTVAPMQAYLGVLGMPGLTAYAGLLDVGGLAESETVYVSGAAGAVGSIVGQIAKLKGATVIGSAGTDEKVAYLQSLGFDYGFNYNKVSPEEQLNQAAEEGVQVYFDNVGGSHLRAALQHMSKYGRIVMCGSISGYNNSDPEPVLNETDVFQITAKELTLRGFIASSFNAQQCQFETDMADWLKKELVCYEETVVDGFKNMPSAFAGLFEGRNLGKMIIKI